MTDQLFYLISACLFGLVLGALIMYFASAKSRKSNKSISEVENKLSSYQQDVVQHFEQTADLVDELTNSYKKVFDHLGKSARELLTKEQVEEQIIKRKDNHVVLGFLTEEGKVDDKNIDIANAPNNQTDSEDHLNETDIKTQDFTSESTSGEEDVELREDNAKEKNDNEANEKELVEEIEIEIKKDDVEWILSNNLKS